MYIITYLAKQVLCYGLVCSYSKYRANYLRNCLHRNYLHRIYNNIYLKYDGSDYAYNHLINSIITVINYSIIL